MAREPATAGFWLKPGPPKTQQSRDYSKNLRRSRRLQQRPRRVPEGSAPPVNPWKPLANADVQAVSPLFSRLPAELRLYIYVLAVAATYVPDPLSRPVSYILPSLSVPVEQALDQPPNTMIRISTSLLLTCRRAYNEAAGLPISTNTHVLWYARSRVLSFPVPRVAWQYFRHMKPWQLAAVRHLHIYAERTQLLARDPGMYHDHTAWAELALLRMLPNEAAKTRMPARMAARVSKRSLCGPRPRELTITIRHHQWWGSGLQGQETVVLDFQGNREWRNVLDGVEVLRLQMEVRQRDVAATRAMAERLRDWTWRIDHERQLICHGADKTIGGGGSQGVREWSHEQEPLEPQIDRYSTRKETFTIFEIEWRLKQDTERDSQDDAI